MWLTIDIGNSRIKSALFDGCRVAQSWSADSVAAWGTKLTAAADAHRLERVGIASVAPDTLARVRPLLAPPAEIPMLTVADHLTLPLRLAYRTPATLGADRLAAAAAAWHLFSRGRPTVVVDAGTALTIDVVRDGAFLGGAIAAGPALERRLLHTGTAALPDLPADVPASPIGPSTRESIQSGIYFGLIDRVRGSVERLNSALGDSHVVVLTGGWREVVARHVPGIDHVDPFLVLRGVQLLMKLNPP